MLFFAFVESRSEAIRGFGMPAGLLAMMLTMMRLCVLHRRHAAMLLVMADGEKAAEKLAAWKQEVAKSSSGSQPSDSQSPLKEKAASATADAPEQPTPAQLAQGQPAQGPAVKALHWAHKKHQEANKSDDECAFFIFFVSVTLGKPKRDRSS